MTQPPYTQYATQPLNQPLKMPNNSQIPNQSPHQNSSPRQNKALSVSELNRQVKRLLEASYSHVWVSGELSSFSRPNSGHWYFSLKDDKAQIRCAMFRGFNQRLRFQPKEGDQIIVRCKVSLYEGRGDYQLIVEDMEPAGLGKLQAAFEALKLKLSQEGLFDPKFKQALPTLPKKLAVVTSETGAVIHDIINVCAKRFPGLEIFLLPVKVQGEGAAEEISRAIKNVNQYQLADVMIVGRGGGSLEDLWAFNEEIVARAISESRIPIVSAVGHEVDFTIADLVADYRAPTPSAAAEAITPEQYELMQRLDRQQRRLEFIMRTELDQRQRGLGNLSSRLKSPQQSLSDKQQRISELEKRLSVNIRFYLRQAEQAVQRANDALTHNNPQQQITKRSDYVESLSQRLLDKQQQVIETHKHRLALAAQTLNTASPLATLGRGYAIALKANEKDGGQDVVRSPAEVSSGDALTIRVEGGDIPVSVQ